MCMKHLTFFNSAFFAVAITQYALETGLPETSARTTIIFTKLQVLSRTEASAQDGDPRLF